MFTIGVIYIALFKVILTSSYSVSNLKYLYTAFVSLTSLCLVSYYYYPISLCKMLQFRQRARAFNIKDFTLLAVNMMLFMKFL